MPFAASQVLLFGASLPPRAPGPRVRDAQRSPGVSQQLLHEPEPEADHLHGLEGEEPAEGVEELGPPAQVRPTLARVPQPRVVREQPRVVGAVVQVVLCNNVQQQLSDAALRFHSHIS